MSSHHAQRPSARLPYGVMWRFGGRSRLYTRKCHEDSQGGNPKRMVETPTRELEMRARAALASSSIYVLRELAVERSGGMLLLSGRVDSFYHKQLAQEVVRAVAEGVQVVNTIAVD